MPAALGLRAGAWNIGPGLRRAGGSAGRRGPAGRQAEGPAQAGDQGFDRQGGVGEVDVDALVLGQLFPELDGQLFLGLGVGNRGDGGGDALGDGLAPVVLLALPGLPPEFGLALRLLPLLPQPGLERDRAADAEEQAAEAGLRLHGAVEIAGRKGGHGQDVKAAGQRLRERHQLGQHRGLVRDRPRGGILPQASQRERDGAANGEEQGAEAGLGLAGAVEIAGRKGGESLGLDRMFPFCSNADMVDAIPAGIPSAASPSPDEREAEVLSGLTKLALEMARTFQAESHSD